MRTAFAKATFLGCLLLAAAAASAQAWPARPLKWIVPYAPGGASDGLVRLLAQKLGDRLGQPVIVENKSGGGGTIGTDFGAKSPPDGYTLILCNIGPMATSAWLRKTPLPYDPQKDIVPISLLMAYGQLVVANPSTPLKTFADLVALAKTRPVSFAGNGVGTSSHLAGELLARVAQMRLAHIPYSGGPPGWNDTMAGTVPVALGEPGPLLPLVQAGKLRPLAITSSSRSPLLPNVPTIAELGYPGFEVLGWVGLGAPKNTPAPIVNRLAQEVTEIMRTPEIQQAVLTMGSFIPPLGPTYFAEFIASETTKWRDVIQNANIKVE